jgi:type IV pilus assembly protein PilC
MAVSKTFAYTARDSSGKVVKGRVDASSETAVVAKLRTLGVAPIAINEAGTGTGMQMEIKIPGMGGRTSRS